MQKIKQFTLSILAFITVFLFLLLPVVSLAQDGLVTCDNITQNCDFNALMAMVNKVISFLLIDLALPLAAIMFAYAGILMVTGAGKEESRTKAKGIFFNTVLGLVLAIAAWLIISTILGILGYNGSWIGLHIEG